MDSKELRERQFHDKAFSESTRESAWKYYAVTADSTSFYETEVRRRAAGKSALDCGCGRGANSRLLASVASQVIAVDISDVALQRTRQQLREKHISNVAFAAMNAEMLGVADDSVDFVCGKAVIHHLDLDRAFAELARVLKQSGTAVFLEPLGHNPIINMYRGLTPQFRTADEHPLKTADLETARKYFGRVDVRYFTLFPLLAVPFRRFGVFPRLVHALGRCDSMLFRLFPPVSRYAWQVVLLLSEPTTVHT